MMEENTMIVGTSKMSIRTIQWNSIAKAESSTRHFRLVLVRTRSGFLLGAIHRETQQLEERATRKQLIICSTQSADCCIQS